MSDSLPAPAFPAASPWWIGATFYQIFVRSFQDSNGDGIGDLRGITARLDYLNSGNPDDPRSLGVQGIWLTPVFKSPSYHGYDATDFMSIDPAYGTLSDFRQLIREAHARGIRVILDLAVNHTSDQHPWFQQSAKDPVSPFHGWYCWMDHNPNWNNPLGQWFQLGSEFYYSTFSQDMPDLNWRNPAVRQEVLTILRYWIEQGVDGFRLDAARYYIEGPTGQPDTPETHAAIREFVQAVKAQFPQILFIGEVWAGSNVIAPYLNGGNELDLAFDFPISAGLTSSLEARDPGALASALVDSIRRIPARWRLAPFLTNHDMVRLPSLVRENHGELKLAAAALLTLPGTPFVYYGEEIGMPNGPFPTDGKSDPAKRTPFLWTPGPNHGFTAPTATPWEPFSTDAARISVATQLGVRGSLLETYRYLIHLRQSEISLRQGDIVPIYTRDPRIAAWLRSMPSEATVVLLNFGHEPAANLAITLPMAAGARPPRLDVLYGEVRPGLLEPAPNQLLITVPKLGAWGAAILKLSENR